MTSSRLLSLFCSILILKLIFGNSAADLSFSPSQISIEVGAETSFSIDFSPATNHTVNITFTYDYGSGDSLSTDGIIDPIPSLVLSPGATSVKVEAKKAGHIYIGGNSSQMNISENVYTRLDVVNSHVIGTLNDVIGWLYFVAWSVSFYPQLWTNFRRKSVIGLNFDFLALNLTGFISYSFFNVGLFWFKLIQDEYLERHSRGVIPVQANDVFFGLHAVAITIITIAQCFIYERGGQRVSRVGIFLTSVAWLFIVVSLILTLASVISWLDFLYYFSYVKLGITLIKYIPQGYMNFRRKSTEGWSIGNVLLDFTGGSLSIIQMFLLSYNNNDWSSIFGDPTKFGLGALSIFFDVIFIIQHYCLYRHASEERDRLINH